MLPKDILLITASYDRLEDNPNLINDLAAQLTRDGHRVTVIAVDWAGEVGEHAHYVERSGVEVIFISPPRPIKATRLGRAARFISAAPRVLREARPYLEGRAFDLVVVMAPLTNQWAPVRWALRRFKCRSYVYVTDFFPYHHKQIGMVPRGPFFHVARWVETHLLRLFDVIGCMSPANLAYLRSHYRLRPGQRVEILPLWGRIEGPEPRPRAAVLAAHDLPLGRRIVVYGGQLGEGRGFEEIFEAARLAGIERPDLFFLIIGAGPLEGRIRDAVAAGQDNIALRQRIPREAHLSLLAACDAGLVCTLPGVDVPTFPSKTIDLLRAGVPVVASVEASTDYGDFVRKEGFGIAVEAGHAPRMLAAIAQIVDRPAEADAMRAAGRKTLEKLFDVRKVSRRLIAQSFPEEAGQDSNPASAD